MADVTQILKPKKKRRSYQSYETDDEAYFYPSNKSLLRDEHKTLDSIYSNSPNDSFWQEKTSMKPSYAIPLSIKLKWFTSGVVLTSLIWLIYFQVNIHQIKSTHRSKVVFQTAATIVTDKTFDKEVGKTLGNETLALVSVNDKPEFKIPFFSDFFAKKSEPIQVAEVQAEADIITENTSEIPPVQNVTYHTIKNGDSLWLIAKEYYGDPSPSNIEKIKQANQMHSGYLYPGKQITIPL